MDELKQIIAKNLIAYRKTSGLTQSELAEKLNYSDKAVSKWERAEGAPDIFTLKAIADIYGITVNDLISEHNENKSIVIPDKRLTNKMRAIITALSATLVWFIATFVYVILLLTNTLTGDAWMAFLFAIPVCFIVLLVFNAIWGKMFFNYVFISGIIWSIAGCIYAPLIGEVENIWLTFLIAVPLQLLTVFWFLLRYVWGKKKRISKSTLLNIFKPESEKQGDKADKNITKK